MIYYNFNQHKCKSYAIDLYNNYFKNNLDAIIANTGIKKNHINNGYIYSKINNKRQNSIL